jgi:CIC family chloride channel protein
VGYETISQALEGKLVWQVLFALVGIKLAATSITLGSGGSGGIFAPSLFLGAMTGGFLGTAFHNLLPDITAHSGAYALVGMGAVVAATTHAPITAILILFELTNDYKIILPLMLACIISTLFAMRLSKDSIYTLKLIRRGVDIFQGRELNVFKSLYVRDIINRSVEPVDKKTSLSILMETALNSPHACFYIQDDENNQIGVIDEIGLRQVLASSDELEHLLIAEDIANFNVTAVREADNLDLVMRLFDKQNVVDLPVVASDRTGKIIGTISRRDVIAAYNKEMLKRDIAGGMASRIQQAGNITSVDVMAGYSMTEWEAPHHFAGRKVCDIALRPKYGVEIIFIKRPGAASNDPGNIEHIAPKADTVIQSGDTLLLFGKKQMLEKLKKA